MTSNIKSEISQQPIVRSSSNFEVKLMGPSQSVQKPQTKMTSNGRQAEMTRNGRWPQNIKSEISQHPLVRSFSNLKLKWIKPKCTEATNKFKILTKLWILRQKCIEALNQKMTSNWKQPKTEDGPVWSDFVCIYPQFALFSQKPTKKIPEVTTFATFCTHLCLFYTHLFILLNENMNIGFFSLSWN
jgi:hypothetical protein